MTTKLATLDLGEDATEDRTISIVDAALASGIEDEKCVVAQYRTTPEQKQIFQKHVQSNPRNHIPVEWVIDIADETNGWFYATAYHYDDTNQMLHVMVPDKINPTFDGHVQLDHRTVHLIESVDGQSDALFNKIIRDSVMKIKWDVEWYEEEEGSGEAGGEPRGNWVKSSARYFIRIANQLLVEDKDLGQETRGFVIITADLNVKLLECHKGRGIEDFQRLINEGVVAYSKEAQETAANGGVSSSGHHHEKEEKEERRRSREAPEGHDEAPSQMVRKLAEMSRNLKESILDIIDEHDQKKAEEQEVAELFHSFILNGELDAGLQLLHHYDNVKQTDKKSRRDNEEEEKIESILDDARYAAGKIEKSLVKLTKTGIDGSEKHEDVDNLKRMIKKLKRELDEKDKELKLRR